MRAYLPPLLAALLAMLPACPPPASAEISTEALAVIAAAGDPHATLSVESLKLIYQRKVLVDDAGRRWVPVNLGFSDPLRRAFSLALFEELPEEQEEYWNNQYFHGITPPQVLASEEAVLRFVALTPGAVGYVRKQNTDARVKVLQVIAPPPLR
jgi:hypothetical protein